MRRAIFVILAVTLFSAAASAQESYSYTVTHTRTLKINWKPEAKTVQRYTVGVNVVPLINLGLKFDFEYELPRPGEWIQAGLIGYAAPSRDGIRDYYYWDSYSSGNDRFTPGSSWDYFDKMWGVGVSALYKKMFHRRGWYFSTGLVLEVFRVGQTGYDYIPYKEDGLTFYESGRTLDMQTYVKPSVQFNIGKHIALSRRCFFDLFAGFTVSYSIYDRDRAGYDYSTMYGFGYRGLNVFNGGFRFGVLLWQ